MQHFKGVFAPIASLVIAAAAGGLCTPDVTLFRYVRLPRPAFVLDDVGV